MTDTNEDAEHAALDAIMGVIMFRLSLLPTLSTGSYVPSGARAAGTKAPAQVWVRDKCHSELEDLLRRYEQAMSNAGRRRIVKEAIAELASWRRRNQPESEGVSVDQMIIEDAIGFSPEMVSEKYGLDPNHIRRIRRRAKRGSEDGKPTDLQAAAKMDVEERRARVREMKNRGVSNRQIGKVLECTEGTVRRDVQSIKFAKSP